MTEIIKKIQWILGNHDSSMIQIKICPTDIWFLIYESEVLITVDKKEKSVCVDCEGNRGGLTADMLDELSKIVRLLEDNIDGVLQFIE